MKKIFISFMATLCLMAFMSHPASAGDKQRHRWQGVAIGVGAAIVGHALISNCIDPAPQRVIVKEKRGNQRACRPQRKSHGRWEMQKQWVPPVTQRIYNPGHYTSCGKWVAGHWMTIETQPGYWTRQKVWVSRR